MDTLRKEADRLVAQIPLKARGQLADLLSDVIQTVDNIDVICPNSYPPCRTHLRFERLRAMYGALTERAKEESPANR